MMWQARALTNGARGKRLKKERRERTCAATTKFSFKYVKAFATELKINATRQEPKPIY